MPAILANTVGIPFPTLIILFKTSTKAVPESTANLKRSESKVLFDNDSKDDLNFAIFASIDLAHLSCSCCADPLLFNESLYAFSTCPDLKACNNAAT